MPYFIILFILLLTGYTFLIEYYRRAWNQVPVFTPDTEIPVTFISVVIALRNEEKHATLLLESLRRQSYPYTQFEVILVDDHSEDDTLNLLEQFDGRGLNKQVISLATALTDNNTKAFKKKALELGISRAKGTLIVTTDADCRFPSDWLLTIARYQKTTGAKFIAAPVRINDTKSFVGLFQTLDFLTLQGITAAAVFKRIHSMCNGANLAYLKSAYDEVEGFAGIDKIASGDDMLLMHKIFLRYPEQVFYLKHPDVIVSTDPVHSWSAFIQQRIRWASKATHYDDKRIFWVLLLVYFVNLAYGILAVWSFFNNTAFFFLILLLIAKWLLEYPFVSAVAAFYGQSPLMKYFPVLQPFHIAYTILAGWLGQFHFEWKGRRIKK